jgi:hypothetical protein
MEILATKIDKLLLLLLWVITLLAGTYLSAWLLKKMWNGVLPKNIFFKGDNV